MKRILICLLFCTIFIFSCCETENKTKMTPQEYFDSFIKLEVVDEEGHMYYLYENTTRRYAVFYVFQLEHRMDCKACLDIFD